MSHEFQNWLKLSHKCNSSLVISLGFHASPLVFMSLCVVHSQFCVSAPVVLAEGGPGRSQGGAEMS